MKPRVVVILGMHRSGTSVLSAGLEALGVEFGENLIPPRPDNPKGYWEDARLVAFNDGVLSLCGFSSGDVGLSSRRVLGVERFEEIVQQAMALLTELLAGKALLGIKDPRMPRLMPIWQAAFDALGLWVDYVIAARHPLSVAESLAARDHLSREKSLMLWYEHSCRSMQWALHKGPWWSTTIDCWLCRDRNWAVLAIDFPCRWTSRLAPASSVMSWMSNCVTHPMMRARWLPQREAFRRCSRCTRHCSSLPWTGSTSKGGRAWSGNSAERCRCWSMWGNWTGNSGNRLRPTTRA